MYDPVGLLVEHLGIDARYARRLAEAGVQHPRDLADWQLPDLQIVRQFGAKGEAEVTAALEGRLGMACGRIWRPPPALLLDPEGLVRAVGGHGVDAVASRLRVARVVVETWLGIHEEVEPEDAPAVARAQRRGSTERAQAILEAGIPVSPERRRLLEAWVEYPDWTARQIGRELGLPMRQVQRGIWLAMRDHPADVVEAYAKRRRRR